MNYTIEGEPLPVVICNLDANETMITEKGAMSWMTPNMNMETTSNGEIGKMFGRAFSGESMFQNRYTAMGLFALWVLNRADCQSEHSEAAYKVCFKDHRKGALWTSV